MLSMNTSRLLVQSLLYYWRTNLAVLLGVIAGTAVIGGALVVGDSVRGSLRKMSLDRLGEIDHVLHSGRFFRENLALELAGDPEFQKRFHSVAPALVMQGGLERSSKSEADGENSEDKTLRVGKVNVYGVDERLWQMTDHGTLEVPQENEVILSFRVGKQLEVNTGEQITLWIELPATVPRDSLLGKREQTSVEIPLVVKAVLADDSGVGRLNLNPNQQLPLNAFVSLKTLQSQLGLAETRIRDPRQRKFITTPARVNGLFVRGKEDLESQRQGEQAPETAKALTTILSRHVTLEDLYLRVVPNPKFDYLSLESEQQILENRLAEAGQAAAKSLKLQTSPVFVYLANEIISKNNDAAYSRYSIVAGVDFAAQSPFGPFEFIGKAPRLPLNKNEIVINDWLRDDLKVNLGDEVRVRYHVVGAHILGKDGRLPEKELTFTVAGIVKLKGTVAEDRGLTPEVEGITDVDSFDDWKKPFPMKAVTKRDDR
ncbi:MAG: hypothetical protein IH899_19825, partial [Planctomycetes bacterium]|nr:hypothetical protein [Planctomycetota bacterium]